MTMTLYRFSPVRALATHGFYIFVLLLAGRGITLADSTTTHTVTLETIVATTTTTITLRSSTFESTAVVPVATVVSGSETATGVESMSSGSVGSGDGAYSGSGFRDAVLNSTNFYREHYQAEPLEWDSGLASYAQNYAKQCIWEHSVRRRPIRPCNNVLLIPDLGRRLRRKPRPRLPIPRPRHRRMGGRGEQIQLRQSQIRREDRPLHPAGLAADDESRLWRGRMRQR